MRKVLLAILCLVGLNAKEGLFIGVGGSYGTGTRIAVSGPAFTSPSKFFKASDSGFPKFELIIGQENFFSENFGIRYYGNINYGLMFGQEDRITNTGFGGNFDLIFNMPLSEEFGLRFYGGFSAEVGILDGKPIDEWRRIYEAWENAQGSYEISRSSLRYALAVNLGMHFLFAKHHALEVGTKIPFLGRKTTLLSYKSTVTNNSPKTELTLTVPPIDFSLKYIFIF